MGDFLQKVIKVVRIVLYGPTISQSDYRKADPYQLPSNETKSSTGSWVLACGFWLFNKDPDVIFILIKSVIKSLKIFRGVKTLLWKMKLKRSNLLK